MSDVRCQAVALLNIGNSSADVQLKMTKMKYVRSC